MRLSGCLRAACAAVMCNAEGTVCLSGAAAFRRRRGGGRSGQKGTRGESMTGPIQASDRGASEAEFQPCLLACFLETAL
eukprot:7486816-Pyramimonas_sp.AAC.1